MIWSIPALEDATIYENDPYRNTGLDQILEIKAGQDPDTLENVEARSLIKFDLSNLNNILSENSISINSISASLVLHTVQTSELPMSYTIQALPIKDTWSNGTGYTTDPLGKMSTDVSDGVTWKTTQGSGSITWVNAAVSSSATTLYNSVAGGGDWTSSYNPTQSFSFKSDDNINIDVTNVVKAWNQQTLINNGFLLKLYNPFSGSYNTNTSIQLYSSETHTVYQPQLYIYWTGSISYSTGSNTVAKFSDNTVVYVKSMRSEYVENSKVVIAIASRPKYPRRTFSQNTDFATTTVLPEQSYYQIKDAHSDEVIIPYSNFTKINTISGSSYIEFYNTMMYPERFYKFTVKSVYSGTPSATEYYDSNEFIFKIVK